MYERYNGERVQEWTYAPIIGYLNTFSFPLPHKHRTLQLGLLPPRPDPVPIMNNPVRREIIVRDPDQQPVNTSPPGLHPLHKAI